MNSRLRFLIPGITLVAALAISACGDDDNPADGGTTDTTPPGVASVTAIDQTHIEVAFNEAVERSSAEVENNYTAILTAPPSPATPRHSGATAGGGLPIQVATLKADNKTVTLTTAAMIAGDYSLTIENIRDRNGNAIIQPVNRTFPGSTVADATPPSLVFRSPGPDATNVSTTALIELTFSEPIFTDNLQAEFSMSSNSGVVNVTFSTDDEAHYTGTHDALALNRVYTVSLSGVQDLNGNPMGDLEWTFRTTSTGDTTPPTLVSSVPAHLATNVDVNADLSLTFSEAIDPNSFEPFFTPDVTGIYEWSLDGRTLRFSPTVPLLEDTQYELEIFPGDVADLAGNDNTALFTRVFTTGAALEPGSIAGTITGDNNSDTAGDPTGAFVVMADGFLFSNRSGFNVYAATTVAVNNTYSAKYLRDDVYYPLCIKNTHDDGWIDPLLGDAIGLFGINFTGGDAIPDSVTITGGSDATGINFGLYDPTSAYGSLYYEGAHSGEFHSILVGLFEMAGFDPNTSVPVAGSEAYWPELPSYVINSLEVGPIAGGNYYIAAYMDANDSGDYEPGTDPAGLFGGMPPTAVNLSNGNDAPNANIVLQDPVPGASATATHWPAKPHAKWLKNLSEAIRQAQLTQK